ncbi:MAG: HEAT repeat domain-containing protein, partial [Candidatus Methylomirabilis sp.]|nr:HEAT repeat domain-containing protein [Deltaproteobacteria bacterium]
MSEDTALPRRTLERLRLLAHGDVKARQHAVDTLIGDGHPVVVRALAEALSDEAPGVREGAAFALATCGP